MHEDPARRSNHDSEGFDRVGLLRHLKHCVHCPVSDAIYLQQHQLVPLRIAATRRHARHERRYAGSDHRQSRPGPGSGELTREELERALAEALAGKDKQFTEDEAARVLDLLDQTNRRAIEDLNKDGNPNQLPDY